MALRSVRERILQATAFEVIGIALVTPLYAVFMHSNAAASAAVVAAVALACLIWSPFHNAAFDFCEWRILRRVASDRPVRLRMVHAASHEVTSVAATTPIIVLLGDMTVPQALLVDLGLTLFYTVYTYVFHIFYDRFRPVLV
jgi:uncharacterized membrane protein